MVEDKAFGFIHDAQGVEYFFHKGMLAHPLDWSSCAEGVEVSFAPVRVPKGRRAMDVTIGWDRE